MTAAAMSAPALIEVVGGRRFWRCPSCRQTMGEVTALQLVVKIGPRVIRVPLRAGIEQPCPRCGCESALDDPGSGWLRRLV